MDLKHDEESIDDRNTSIEDDKASSNKALNIPLNSDNDFQANESNQSRESDDSGSKRENVNMPCIPEKTNSNASTSTSISFTASTPISIKSSAIPLAKIDVFQEAIYRICSKMNFNGSSRVRYGRLQFDQTSQTELTIETSNYCRTFKERQDIQAHAFICLHKSSRDLNNQLEYLARLKEKMILIQDKYGKSLNRQSVRRPSSTIVTFSSESDENHNFSGDFPVENDANRSPEATSKRSTPSSEQRMRSALSNPIPPDSAEMIPIGSGYTMIPKHVYDQIRWSCYKSATRNLLMAVFPRRTLATRSLSGRRPLAIRNTAPKMKLDSKKVRDIIMAVSQVCSVHKNLVRSIISMKCSDENKMYRLRMHRKKIRKLARQ